MGRLWQFRFREALNRLFSGPWFLLLRGQVRSVNLT